MCNILVTLVVLCLILALVGRTTILLLAQISISSIAGISNPSDLTLGARVEAAFAKSCRRLGCARHVHLPCRGLEDGGGFRAFYTTEHLPLIPPAAPEWVLSMKSTLLHIHDIHTRTVRHGSQVHLCTIVWPICTYTLLKITEPFQLDFFSYQVQVATVPVWT